MRVSFYGRVDAELAALITSELAANGRSAYVVLETDAAISSGDPTLEIHLEAEVPYMVAHPAPGGSSTAELASDDPEAAALGAVSLVLELARAPAVEGGAAPSFALALADPATSATELEADAPRAPPPRRGFALDVGGTTGILVNGGSVALGAFVSPELLVLVHGSALHLWTTDRFVGIASASIAYVGRVESVDLELGVEGGLLAVDTHNRSTPGALLGGFAGLAASADPAMAVLVRLGVYAGEVEGRWAPGLLLTIGARITP